jgi:hypothetical protein
MPGGVSFLWKEAVRGIYKHSAGGGWASDISRLKTWDWDGPQRVCTDHTPHESSSLYCYVCQCRLNKNTSVLACVRVQVLIKIIKKY